MFHFFTVSVYFAFAVYVTGVCLEHKEDWVPGLQDAYSLIETLKFPLGRVSGDTSPSE